jgi:hypothetical protein
MWEDVEKIREMDMEGKVRTDEKKTKKSKTRADNIDPDFYYFSKVGYIFPIEIDIDSHTQSDE